ncbi:MAG: hypothetical protein E6J75_02210 [Deltaproteobacteria bacterium]|nr:MAG: hypothetical protein E6J75_02210 [Deltaproteobacteria bacterium]
MPRLHEALDAGEHAGDDADPIADADPGQRPRPLGGDDPADRVHLVVRHGVERVPALAEDAHHAVGAGDTHVGLARGQEAEEEVAGEEGLVEDHPPVAPPARHAHARQEHVQALALERALDLRLVLVPRPDREPALGGGAGLRCNLRLHAHGTMSSVGISGPTKSSSS